MSELCKPVVKL